MRLPRFRRCRAAAVPLLLALAGCHGEAVEMNRSLAESRTGPGYRLEDVNAAGGAADTIVIVAMSGGGKRSAAFGHGVLRGMRSTTVRFGGRDSTLLEEVDQVSGVSGGSFPASHLALHGTATFDRFRADFLDQDVEAYIYGTFLLPWNWAWLFDPLYGTNDRMAGVYDRLIYRGATFADLARRGRPQVSVIATDISYGQPFAFTPAYFDLICSDLGSFPVARAVAASNGFPILFTPITLRNHRDGCPTPPAANPGVAHAEPDLRMRALARTEQRYADPRRTAWIHLMDGGISDNLALRASANNMLLLRRDLRANAESLGRLRRILVISVDGEAAADPSWPRQRVVTAIGQIASAVSGAQIDNYNVETLLFTRSVVDGLVRDIAALRCARAPVIGGHPCADVRGHVVHLSLSDDPDTARRERLQAIPTGLTIPADDVTTLLDVGEAVVRSSPDLRAALDDLGDGAAPAVVPAARRRPAGRPAPASTVRSGPSRF